MAMTVSYSPVAAVETLAAPGEEPRAYVARFTDERLDKDRDQIGAMKSAVGLRVKKLVTTDDFGTILAEAATDALRKAGVKAELHLDRTATEAIPNKELVLRHALIDGCHWRLVRQCYARNINEEGTGGQATSGTQSARTRQFRCDNALVEALPAHPR